MRIPDLHVSDSQIGGHHEEIYYAQDPSNSAWGVLICAAIVGACCAVVALFAGFGVVVSLGIYWFTGTVTFLAWLSCVLFFTRGLNSLDTLANRKLLQSDVELGQR